MSHTYLTTQELSERIKYNPRTIRNELKDSVLIEGIHYIRPFGGRKILYVWEEIEKWIRTNTADYEEVTLIGSGGNINKLFKMSGKQQDKPLSYIYINSQYAYLSSLTYEQRISQLGLNSDRADVIVPATRIYLNAMKWSGARQIYVPKIGLSDGIVKAMYYGKI